MSSNIEIQRICQHCKNQFTARTTVTKLCSDKCRKAAYKVRLREEKIQKSNEETILIKNNYSEDTAKKGNYEVIKTKEFLSVQEVAILLGYSVRTVYRLIDSGKIPGVNPGQRLTRVKRSELDKILEQAKPIEAIEVQYELSECYKLDEVRSKYNISDKALHDVIKRNNIPKTKKGWYTFIPKVQIDKILS